MNEYRPGQQTFWGNLHILLGLIISWKNCAEIYSEVESDGEPADQEALELTTLVFCKSRSCKTGHKKKDHVRL